MPGDPFSSDALDIRIGDGDYSIPRNHLSRMVKSDSEESFTRVTLLALWPDMEPRTQENRRDWRYYDAAGVRVAQWNAERQIRIVLNANGSDGYERFRNAVRLGRLKPEPGNKRYGLTSYEERIGRFLTTYYVAETDLHRSPQGTPLVLRCKDATAGMMELFPVKIRCEVSYVLEDGVGLFYNFYTASLEDWKERDLAVRALVTSFRSPR